MKDTSYYVIREERPHTNATHIIRVRYLNTIINYSLEAQFEAATKFKDIKEARQVADEYIRWATRDGIRYPLPQGTIVQVIKCDFTDAYTYTEK